MSFPKILIVSPYFFPNIEWGGPVTIIWSLAQALENLGMHVEVLTTDVSRTGIAKSLKNNNDKINIVYAKSIFSRLSWKFRIFLSIDQIIKGLKMVPGFDIVHFQDVYILQNIVLSSICRKNNIPYTIAPHGNLSFAKERSKTVFKKMFYTLFAKRYFENACRIIVNSKSEKESVARNFPILIPKLVLIPHLIQNSKFEKIDIRSKFHIPKDDLVILFLGRIYELKGVKELLLGFVYYLKTVGARATLILAGPDAGGMPVIRRILQNNYKFSEKVTIAGEVYGDLKQNFLEQCDIVALLSKSETIPTSLIEAASFGKPIICSKECNIKDLVSRGGAILSTRDAENVSRSIQILAKSKRTREETGKKARVWFNRSYDPGKILAEYLKIYEDFTQQ